MEQTFKISLDTNAAAHLLRADVLVTSGDGKTSIAISAPVSAEVLRLPLAQARAEVLRAAVELLQDQSRTPEAPGQ